MRIRRRALLPAGALPTRSSILRRAFALAPIAICSACATVPSGYGAVLITPIGGVQARTLGEGIQLVPPLSRVDLFDLRAQEYGADLVGITADGAPVQASASMVTYRLVPDELPAFDREVGPDPRSVLLDPILGSTVRRVISGYRMDQLDTRGVRRAEDEIARVAAARLRPYHLVLDAVRLRAVTLRSRVAYAAVLRTAMLEQETLALPQRLMLARQRAEAVRENARATAAAHALVAATLTPEVLANLARRAWGRLLTAPSTKVEVLSADHPSRLEVTP